jgi:lysozyme
MIKKLVDLILKLLGKEPENEHALQVYFDCGPQHINPAGIALIKEFEGLRLKAYKCSAGRWTIGYGHTATTKPGMVISEGEANKLLFDDIGWAEEVVRRLAKAPMTNNQFSALVSFVFNLGEGAFARSTLLRKLNLRDYNGAAEEFQRWVYADGKVLRGLERRRAAEKALFIKE